MSILIFNFHLIRKRHWRLLESFSLNFELFTSFWESSKVFLLNFSAVDLSQPAFVCSFDQNIILKCLKKSDSRPNYRNLLDLFIQSFDLKFKFWTFRIETTLREFQRWITTYVLFNFKTSHFQVLKVSAWNCSPNTSCYASKLNQLTHLGCVTL